jgi:hypothetical protein
MNFELKNQLKLILSNKCVEKEFDALLKWTLYLI